jgi:hypothetical protein
MNPVICDTSYLGAAAAQKLKIVPLAAVEILPETILTPWLLIPDGNAITATPDHNCAALDE